MDECSFKYSSQNQHPLRTTIESAWGAWLLDESSFSGAIKQNSKDSRSSDYRLKGGRSRDILVSSGSLVFGSDVIDTIF